MNCLTCGSALVEGAKFCGTCGTRVPSSSSNEQTTPPVKPTEEIPVIPTPVQPISKDPPVTPPTPPLPGAQYPTGYPAPVIASKKNKKPLIFGIVAVAILILGVAVYAFVDSYTFGNRGRNNFIPTPMTLWERALENTGREIAIRFNATPFAAYPMFISNLVNGTNEIKANISSIGLNADVEFTLMSDALRGDFGLASSFELSGFLLRELTGLSEIPRIELDIFANAERFAFRQPLFFGDNHFGFRYETMREEIGDLLGNLNSMPMIGMFMPPVDRNEVYRGELGVAFDYLERLQGMPQLDLDELIERYVSHIEIALQEFEFEPAEEQIILINGVEASAQVFNLSVNQTHLATLLDGLREYILADEVLWEFLRLTETFLLYLDPYSIPMGIDEARREFDEEMRYGISEIENFNFLMDTDIFIVNERIARMEQIINYDDEHFAITTDFGFSVIDDWTMSVKTQEWDWESNSMRPLEEALFVRWSYTETNDNFNNRLSFTTYYGVATSYDSWSEQRRYVTFELESRWNAATGAFTLGFNEDGYSDSIRGNYMPTEPGGFTFSMNEFINSGGLGVNFNFTLTSSPTVNLSSIDHISIGEIISYIDIAAIMSQLPINDIIGGIFGF